MRGSAGEWFLDVKKLISRVTAILLASVRAQITQHSLTMVREAWPTWRTSTAGSHAQGSSNRQLLTRPRPG
jgi:hypothetical protein